MNSTGKMSDKQRDFLLSFLEENPKLAKNQLDLNFTREMAKIKWLEAANKLNSLGGACKTVKQWKRTWTDMKVASKKKAANMKKQCLKTGGGPVTSSSEEDDDEDEPTAMSKEPEPTASMPATERVLSLLGQTVVEGMRGIKEIGIGVVQHASESDEEDEPLPKRPNLKTGDSQNPTSKRKIVGDWLENSKKKVEALQNVASALNNIAHQIGRLADTFEVYNNATL